VRLHVVPARLRFYVAFLFPELSATPAAVSESYEKLTGTVQRLGYLQTGSLNRSRAAVL
jgi:hypothetical protein